jgi:hypothetical protein
MKKAILTPFYVIICDVNRNKMEPYDIMPRLIDAYVEAKEKPKEFWDFKDFVKKEAMYMWWSKCEYEIILRDWPTTEKVEEKWDVYKQVMMNWELVTRILMENINGRD